MRCRICDFKPGSPNSLFRNSLGLKTSPDNKLIESSDSPGEFICTDCWSDIWYSLDEFSEEDSSAWDELDDSDRRDIE